MLNLIVSMNWRFKNEVTKKYYRNYFKINLTSYFLIFVRYLGKFVNITLN